MNMLIIFAVLIAFVVPVLFVLRREWKLKKAEEAKLGGALAKKKEPVAPVAVIKVMAGIMLLIFPVFFLSDAPYRFYSPDEAIVKVAFKHTGNRKVDCGEADLFKKEGERYRRELKDSTQVKMSMEKLLNCPRERHPVIVELFMDGDRLLDKAYSPTGLKKDMASYIYDEFMIKPGGHRFEARIYVNGTHEGPEHTLSTGVDVRPGEVMVVRVDDKLGQIVLE